MCIRQEKTGKSYLTNDAGESDYMCPKCEFADECHTQTARAEAQAKMRQKLRLEDGEHQATLFGTVIA